MLVVVARGGGCCAREGLAVAWLGCAAAALCKANPGAVMRTRCGTREGSGGGGRKAGVRGSQGGASASAHRRARRPLARPCLGRPPALSPPPPSPPPMQPDIPLGRRATLIPTVSALPGRPHADAALALLHAVAWQAEVVQRRRGWSVGRLVEFEPRSPNLLVRGCVGGVCGGESALRGPFGGRRWPRAPACVRAGSRPRYFLSLPTFPPQPRPAPPTLSQGLNVGGGGGRAAEIRLRLRPPGRGLDFYPYDHLLGARG